MRDKDFFSFYFGFFVCVFFFFFSILIESMVISTVGVLSLTVAR